MGRGRGRGRGRGHLVLRCPLVRGMSVEALRWDRRRLREHRRNEKEPHSGTAKKGRFFTAPGGCTARGCVVHVAKTQRRRPRSARKRVTIHDPSSPARVHLPTRETMVAKKTSSPIKKVTKGKKGSFQKFQKGMHQQAKANDQKITSAEISAKWNELGEGATYIFGGATDAPEA